MKLKNDALQELYDTVVANTITISQFDTAFRECDEKLSESITFAYIKDLQDRNDILEKSEKVLLEANLKLASEKKELEKEVEDLKSRPNSIYGDEHIKTYRYWKCTLEGTFEINKDLLNKVCGIGSFADFDPEIRQKECFAEMYADMTVVDYPERFLQQTGKTKEIPPYITTCLNHWVNSLQTTFRN